MMGKIGRLIRSLFFPVRCPYCNKPIDYRSEACEDCLNENLGHIYKRTLEIYDNVTATNIAATAYDGNVREAICNYKFYGKKDYAYQFALSMKEAFNKYYRKKDYDFITSVPLSKHRIKERGYNQAELLARVLSKELKIPYKEVLVKFKENKIQHNLGLEDRIANVKGVYKVSDETLVQNKKILICDDIITTSSTLTECIKVLTKAGAKGVDAITFSDTNFK